MRLRQVSQPRLTRKPLKNPLEQFNLPPATLGKIVEPKVATMTKRLCLIAAVVAAGINSAQAEPAFQFDPASNRVVSISNLSKGSTCDARPFRGTVTKRQFEDDRVTVAGFILELPDGSRHFVGVDLDTQGLTLNRSGWVIRGLQTLLTQGNFVDVSVKSCDGYFVKLDAVLAVVGDERE
jgi:hypothetical protein